MQEIHGNSMEHGGKQGNKKKCRGIQGNNNGNV
jgi:hypothetical protein